MTRVIHTGDTHIGYRQYHEPARRRDFLDAFRQVVDDAVASDVDAVVHAGDLFHDRRPDLQDLLGTLGVLRDLDDAGVPFLAVVGNHEGKRDAQWLDLFTSLGLATRLGDEPVVVGDTAFYGLDFVPRSQRADLDYEFAPHDAEHAALVAHGLFEPFEFADWDTERLLTEATVDFDALLLGDNHQPDTAQVEDTWVTYCGSTERASADERDDRGYNIVAFEDGEAAITRRGLETREFVFVDVDLREGEGIERVGERVGQHDVADAVVVVTIEGDGEPVAPAHVEERLLAEGALVARVNDTREVAGGDDPPEVSFADPDEAVRERVRDLGLSGAARDLDETIRASKVADANVADAVEEHVRELVDDGDLDAFAPAPDESADRETAAAKLAGDDATDDNDETAKEADDDATDDNDETAKEADDDATDGRDGTADAESETSGTDPAPGAASDATDAGAAPSDGAAHGDAPADDRGDASATASAPGGGDDPADGSDPSPDAPDPATADGGSSGDDDATGDAADGETGEEDDPEDQSSLGDYA